MNIKQSRRGYYIYLLRCSDGSYYTGITNHLQRRMQQHFGVLSGGAKYTHAHPPICLELVLCVSDRPQALRWEYRIRRLTHAQKWALIQAPALLREYFNDDFERISIVDRERWSELDLNFMKNGAD